MISNYLVGDHHRMDTCKAEESKDPEGINREQSKLMRNANYMFQDEHRHTRNPQQGEGDL